MPEIQINYIAVIVAVVANFFLGFIWYNPLFGRAWAVEMGMDPDEQPEKGELIKGIVIMLIGNFFLAYVFAHNITVWNPETWGMAPSEMPKLYTIISAAIFTWLGFFVPVDIGAVAWERKTWKLFFINTSYHLITLILVAAILVYM